MPFRRAVVPIRGWEVVAGVVSGSLRGGVEGGGGFTCSLDDGAVEGCCAVEYHDEVRG